MSGPRIVYEIVYSFSSSSVIFPLGASPPSEPSGDGEVTVGVELGKSFATSQALDPFRVKKSTLKLLDLHTEKLLA